MYNRYIRPSDESEQTPEFMGCFAGSEKKQAEPINRSIDLLGSLKKLLPKSIDTADLLLMVILVLLLIEDEDDEIMIILLVMLLGG